MLAHDLGKIAIVSTVAAGGGSVLALGVASRVVIGPPRCREKRRR
jgi:hypothetical protein